MDHWRRGHKQICKKIHRGGNAEQYHANKKYKEAVAEAVEACADDTKGQTCFICTQALHWKTKEGLVRGCACRGTAGFAHVSCLAEQAKLLVAEAVGDGATLDDLREAVTTLEDAERIARRVLGAAHPLTTGIEEQLQNVRAALRAHETPSPAGSATAGIGGH
jgi:hypothetical protein